MVKEAMQNSLKRRTFLQLLGAFTVAACGDDATQASPQGAAEAAGEGGAAGSAGSAGAAGVAGEGGAAGAPPDPPKLGGLWELIEDMKRGVAGSPDNLPAQAAALVAAKDAQGLYTLVRDRITTVPFTDLSEPGYNGDAARMLWGPRATLRSGAGSPRDKVELLKDLLTQAGFSAKVVLTSYQPEQAEVAAHFARKEIPAFQPKEEPGRIEAWVEHLKIPQDKLPEEAPPAVDPTGAEATALADALLAQLTLQEPLAEAKPVWVSPTPAVSAEVDGKTVVLQPLRPGAAFGEELGEVFPDESVATSEEVKVWVESIWSDNQSWEPMVEGTWKAHDLAGRQLQFSAVPLIPTAAFLQSNIDGLDSFLPLLGVQATDQPDKPFSKELSVAGEGFSLGGEKIAVAEDGKVRVNGVEILSPGQVGPAEQVASVEVLASGLQFPKVRLRVRALDGAGKPVLGLGPAAFEVSEDGKKRSALVRANSTARRVLVLVDESLSMPPEYLDAQGQALLDGIRSDLLALDPTLEVDAVFTDSNVWTNLSAESQSNPGAIVYITDGDTTDSKTAAIEAALKVSPAAYLINVSEELNPELTEMAKLTGGEAVSVKTPAEARQQAVKFLQGTPAPDYVLTYEAPRQGPAERAVSVVINQKVGEGSYTVPVQEERVPGRQLIGLRLSVEMGGQAVTRPLFGYESGGIDAEQIARWSDQMRASLRSTVAISFDGERPLPSVLAQEGLTFIESYRTALDASLSGDTAKAIELLSKGAMSLPPGLGEMRVDRKSVV